jgi:glycosyltransferase involved in cell wall biosynthesis
MEARDPRIAYMPIKVLHPGPPLAITSPTAALTLERHIRDFAPDVVHASLPVGILDAQLPRICARLDVPLVVNFHISFARTINAASAASAATYTLARGILTSAAAVVASGPHQRQWMKRFGGVDEARIHLVPYGVNHVRFCPGQSEWRQRIREGFVVGYVGRLSPEKNLDALCLGFLQAELENARLVIVGQGTSERRLKRKYGIAPSVSMLGVIHNRSEVADIMRGFDVFVLPSLIEGFSLALLEAMASGVVPVATDVGEHHSLVDGCGVLLHPSRVGEGVRRVLIELAAHPERVRTLAQASRARARRRGWDHTTHEIMELYRKIVI